MRISALCTAVVTYVVIGHPPPALAQVDQQLAQEYFREAQALCERDGGRLWGVPICRPMVIADRRTQTIATSQRAPEAARPPLLGLLNAPVQWGGATWSAYMWADVVNRTPRERKELFLHELFHCVQSQLGVAAPSLDSEHLDAADGRYWLRLEWRALARALRESGEPRNLAVRDALAFRQARRTLYAANVQSERGQEITEGLAAYTGTVLAAESPADAIASAIDLLVKTESAALEASFVRTFAYMSGPAYGLLLDASSPGWTRRVRGTDDLGTLVMRALAVQPASDAAASAARYDGAQVRASEQQRAQQREQRLADLRRRFVDGPVLLFPGEAALSSTRSAPFRFQAPARCISAPTTPPESGERSARKRVCSSPAMAARAVCRRPSAATMARSPAMAGRSRRRRVGWCAKAHGGATTKSFGSSRERHSRAFAGRAVRSCRVRLFNVRTRHRSCPDPRASAVGDDGRGVWAQRRSGAHARRASAGTPQRCWHHPLGRIRPSLRCRCGSIAVATNGIRGGEPLEAVEHCLEQRILELTLLKPVGRVTRTSRVARPA